MRKVYKKQSLWSKIVNFSLIFFHDKANSSTEEAAKKFIEKNSLKKYSYNNFKKFSKYIIDDFLVFTYNGTLDKTENNVILYVHGGNFVQRPNKFQIDFAMKVAKKSNATLVVPLYDLLPNGNYKMMSKQLKLVYDRILQTSPSRIIFIGDSAGGGAILSFSIQLREMKMLQPTDIILISPWLDLSMSNPQLYIDEKKDRMNSVAGIKYEGNLWAANDDVYNPLISPMYGNFNDLGYITLIFGGKEILSSECKKFDELLMKQNIEHNYIFYEKEGHDFALFPTKESKQVIKMIIEIFDRKL